jgi:hypothetical protein
MLLMFEDSIIYKNFAHLISLDRCGPGRFNGSSPWSKLQ